MIRQSADDGSIRGPVPRSVDSGRMYDNLRVNGMVPLLACDYPIKMPQSAKAGQAGAASKKKSRKIV